MNERTAESNKIKQAINIMGIRVKVRHGVGTSHGWLYVYVPKGSDHKALLSVVQHVTGRHGEYDGKINLFSYE